jgi:oligoendopeptidase F
MEIRARERSEIDEKYKWDLSVVYNSIDKWEEDFNVLENMMENFIHYKGKVLSDSDKLLEVLKTKDEIGRLYQKLSSYAMHRSDEDTRDSASDKIKNKIATLGATFDEESSFFVPELMKLNRNRLSLFLNENDGLKIYSHYLKNILRFKKHTLSIKEEKILASASEILTFPSKTFSKLNDADIKFGNIKDEEGNIVQLSKGNYVKYISSQDRKVRKETYETFYKGYIDHRNTFTETLIGDIKANYFISKNRKYLNPLEMSLYYNNIDPKVYDNTIKVVNDNIDKMHKYIKMKKNILGLDEMHMYDFYVDLIKEYDIDYKYEDAVDLIFKALEPMGEDYIRNAKKIFDNRWIDVYENVGKRSGAYSSFGYDTPPYILLNYNGKLGSVSTIIHELGHSMHSFYSSKTQPFIYHEYAIFLAEIASNVNEMLLNMYMLKSASNRQEKLSLINDFLESVRNSIYRQTMFAEFEKMIYEKEGNKETLTEEALSSLYYDLNKKYYGNDVLYDDNISHEWMRIPHFYYQFYVYQYATGLTAAFFIAKDLFEGKRGVREKYIEFLSSGSSEYPLQLLKKMSIDLTKEDAMNRVLEYFDEQIDEFISLINEK